MKVNDLNKTIIGTLFKNGSPKVVPKTKMWSVEKTQKDPVILESAKKFEGLFIQHLMSEMMKTTGDEFMGKGLSGDIFKTLFVQNMSDQLSEGRGIGLAEMVYEYFDKTGYTANSVQRKENNE